MPALCVPSFLGGWSLGLGFRIVIVYRNLFSDRPDILRQGPFLDRLANRSTFRAMEIEIEAAGID